MTIPVRIAVRVDFSDGSQHEHEVRTQDAVPAPGGFWPEGVTTPDTAKRIEHDRGRQEEIETLRADLDCLLAVATLYLGAFRDDETMTLPEKLRLQGVEEVVNRHGRRY
jgi:hypothetical protein